MLFFSFVSKDSTIYFNMFQKEKSNQMGEKSDSLIKKTLCFLCHNEINCL